MKTGTIKYIFCDLDGTLLDDDKRITMRTKESIKELKNRTSIKFGIASGRSLTSLLPLLMDNEIMEYVDVIVANNGVDLYTPKNKKCRRQHMVSVPCIQTILKAYEVIEEVNICFHNPNVFYAQKVTKRVSYITNINKINIVFHPNHDTSYVESPRVMLLFDPQQKERMEEIVSSIHIKGVKGMFSEKDIYEYVNVMVSKDICIEEYVTTFKDTMDQVLVIGDSYNDIEMLQRCGIGIVMKNAEKDIYSNGDMVSSYSNNEEGVAYILESFINNKKKVREL